MFILLTARSLRQEGDIRSGPPAQPIGAASAKWHTPRVPKSRSDRRHLRVNRALPSGRGVTGDAADSGSAGRTSAANATPAPEPDRRDARCWPRARVSGCRARGSGLRRIHPLMVGRLLPSIHQRPPIEQRERDGNDEQHDLIDGAGNRCEPQCCKPSKRFGDALVGCGQLHRAKGLLDEGNRACHAWESRRPVVGRRTAQTAERHVNPRRRSRHQ